MILPVKYRQLLDHPASAELFAEYERECSLTELGKPKPSAEIYGLMEKSGAMQVFTVYSHESLVGFFNIIIYTVPHYDEKIAATESLFLSSKCRRGIIGMDMLQFIKEYGLEKRCKAVQITAPLGSRLAALLSASDEYRHSNNVYVMAL